MKNRIINHTETIKNLPIFHGLNKDELLIILKNAHINKHKKGEILSLNNQKVVNFYIVLSGLVKLFVSNSEGDETVVQIADSGKFITDLFSETFSTDAQILRDTFILTIPTKKLREYVKENSRLAMNMLINTSLQNKDLTNQIVQLKLGDAKQKVGQFLLKSAFENGKKVKNFTLKSDKAAIASYLGIRSETLSRNLKKLKNEGEIVIKKNKLTLLQDHSLCSYCNDEIGTKCSDRGSSFCKMDRS